MRILQIAPPWFAVPPSGYGGIERVVASLADGLVDAGHDVTVAASGGSGTRARLLTVFDDPPADHLGEPAYDLRHCLAALQCVRDYDVVHDHSGLIAAAMGSLLDEVPFVHTVHGSWEPHVVPVYRAICHRVSLVAVSESQRSLAPAAVRIADVVHNGIDVDTFPFRGEPRAGDGPLAFVGRATPDKGPDLAIDVAKRLGRSLLMAIKVNEPMEQRYWSEVLQPRLAGADAEVVLNADRGATNRVLAAADVTLVPIRWAEPFGLVMAESMAVGTPVVAYASGAATEVVADGLTGALVPPDGDLSVFCDAVERAVSLPPQRCRDWVTQRFSADAMVRGYERVYRRLRDDDSGRRLSVAAMS